MDKCKTNQESSRSVTETHQGAVSAERSTPLKGSRQPSASTKAAATPSSSKLGGGDEPQVLTPRRTEEGREHRRLTKGKDEHFSTRKLVRREDGVSNTITTVLKDNYVSIPIQDTKGELDEDQVSLFLCSNSPPITNDIPVSGHPLHRPLEFKGFSAKGYTPALRASDHKSPICVIVETG